MNAPRIAALVLALALLRAAAPAQAPAAPATLTPAQFAAECGRWEERLQPLSSQPSTAAALRATAPRQWIVGQDGQSITISAAWLGADLDAVARQHHASQAVADATQRLAALRRQAEGASTAPPSFAAERAKAGEILSRREFAGVAPPNWLDRFLQRAASWIDRLLTRIVGHAFEHPLAGNVLVWILIAAALVVLALFTYRRLTREEAREETRDRQALPSASDWSSWAQRAAAAAARGEFREALHCAYWTAIYRLEAAGAWRPDPARTPREYLRVLPGDSLRRSHLLAITHKFELAWYGHHAATRLDFEESAAELEKLGCALTSTQATAKS